MPEPSCWQKNGLAKQTRRSLTNVAGAVGDGRAAFSFRAAVIGASAFARDHAIVKLRSSRAGNPVIRTA